MMNNSKIKMMSNKIVSNYKMDWKYMSKQKIELSNKRKSIKRIKKYKDRVKRSQLFYRLKEIKVV